MIFNLLMHIVAGIFGPQLFTVSSQGILLCLAFTAVVQGVDMRRIYKEHKGYILARPPEVREEQLKTFNERKYYTFPWLYVTKMLFYGSLTLGVAAIVRSL
ncbi:hypothetical protein ACEZHJ_12945 [Arhodomonas sp. KWT2]|uniref:hypothetical protein n=1 Tax=unclassified Arhodomonas TaxID=2621637 RepID=UPI0013D25257|nr:hypothetical protein [Arhodomonas sp. KWT]